MRLLARPSARHQLFLGLGLTLFGLGTMKLGLLQMGIALLFALGWAEAWGRLELLRGRAAGFELSLLLPSRYLSLEVGKSRRIRALLINRGGRPIRFEDLQGLASEELQLVARPEVGELAAQSQAELEFELYPQKVGRLGLFSVSLSAVCAPGHFETQLSFTTPLVFQVLPSPGTGQLPPHLLRSALGTRRPERSSDGQEFRELREHRSGDPYRSIAWKASARRGKLLTIEREERHDSTGFVVLDSRVEALQRESGSSRQEKNLALLMRLAEGHLNKGAALGLSIVGARELHRLQPGRGARQERLLCAALSQFTHSSDADRSAWDSGEVERRLKDLGRALLGARAAQLRPQELASQLLAIAPSRPAPLTGEQAADTWARRALHAYGIESPPRRWPDGKLADLALGRVLEELGRTRPRPAFVDIISAELNLESSPWLFGQLQALARRQVRLSIYAPSAPAPLAAPAVTDQQATPDQQSLPSQRATPSPEERELQLRLQRLKINYFSLRA